MAISNSVFAISCHPFGHGGNPTYRVFSVENPVDTYTLTQISDYNSTTGISTGLGFNGRSTFLLNPGFTNDITRMSTLDRYDINPASSFGYIACRELNSSGAVLASAFSGNSINCQTISVQDKSLFDGSVYIDNALTVSSGLLLMVVVA